MSLFYIRALYLLIKLNRLKSKLFDDLLGVKKEILTYNKH